MDAALIRNAIIMAAGTSSRFVPLSTEIPKGLLEVKGEILIERQIRQLKEAGVNDITIVVGYQAEKFLYLKEKYEVNIVINEDYDRYNNTSSMIRVLDRLGNTFICSSDNYFPNNVFTGNLIQSYYSALYAKGMTEEYCIQTDSEGIIIGVKVGGRDSWYMVGHVFFSEEFSAAFRKIFEKDYNNEEVRLGYWEDVFIRHIDNLPPMSIRKFSSYDIEEFDTLDELRAFDKSYISDTRSSILKDISIRMNCRENQLSNFRKISHNGEYLLFSFCIDMDQYLYSGQDNSIKKL